MFNAQPITFNNKRINKLLHIKKGKGKIAKNLVIIRLPQWLV